MSCISRFVGIIRHGKCKLVKRISKSGTALTPHELVQIHECETAFLKQLKEWYKDTAENTQAAEKPTANRRMQCNKEPTVEDYIANEFPKVASIDLGTLGRRQIIGDASMLKMDTKERHDLSIYADTVVQIVFLERKSLSEILSKESLLQLKRKLPVYPSVKQLYETYVERIEWDRYRRRTLHNNLKVSAKGEKFLRMRREAQGRKTAISEVAGNNETEREAHERERELERSRRRVVRIKAQARTNKDRTSGYEEQLPETTRPMLLSIDHTDAFICSSPQSQHPGGKSSSQTVRK